MVDHFDDLSYDLIANVVLLFKGLSVDIIVSKRDL